MKPIVHIPDPVLTAPAKTVVSFDKKLGSLIAAMRTTLIHTKNPRGVGLAAPQIGEPWRVFLTRPTTKADIRVFINPEILSRDPEPDPETAKNDTSLEGCLSIPGVWGKVVRSQRLTLRWQDETGAVHEEEFSGFMATIIQHETDHLGGVLFTHRVVSQHGKLYATGHDKEGNEVLDEITLK